MEEKNISEEISREEGVVHWDGTPLQCAWVPEPVSSGVLERTHDHGVGQRSWGLARFGIQWLLSFREPSTPSIAPPRPGLQLLLLPGGPHKESCHPCQCKTSSAPGLLDLRAPHRTLPLLSYRGR